MNQSDNQKTISYKESSITVIFFIFAVSLSLTLSFINYDNQRTSYLEAVTQQQKDKIARARDTLGKMAEFSFESIIFNNHIVELMAQAKHGSVLQQAQARDTLYKALYRDYQQLKKYHVRQLHFHLPESVSFLRFHRPDKFGDSLVTARPSLNKVNETLKPVYGFEEGRIFNGFRHIYPLFYYDEFVGSVEISYGLDGISHVLAPNQQSSEIFLISRNIIESKLFEDEYDNYQTSIFGHDWVVDKIAGQASSNLNTLPQTTIKLLNAKVKDEFNTRILNKENCTGCTLAVDFKEHTYTVSFLPIYNVENRHAGFIVSYNRDLFLSIIYANKQKFDLILVLLISMSSFALYAFQKRRRKAIQKIEYSAHHDALTGIFNRKELMERLPDLLRQAKQQQAPIAAIFFDIDHFKVLNDTHGHAIGDEVLKSVARIVSQNLREDDLFIRWGGEEFLVVVDDSSADNANNIAEKLRVSIENHAFTHLNLKVTCSFGVTLSQPGYTSDKLLEIADQKLYRAKESGRNIVVS